MLRKIKLVLEYNGAGFHGWQIQKNLRTVQGTLNQHLEKIVHHPVKVHGASRTDAGVHALAQTAHFETAREIPAENFQKGLNSLLPSDISIVSADETGLEFHARYSSTGKKYLYRCYLRQWASPFLTKFAWHIRYRIDVAAMEQACRCLVGEHDFSGFRPSSCSAKSPVRTIRSITFTKQKEFLDMTIEGSGFLHHMIRTIMGTLVAIGNKQMVPEDMHRILASKDRSNAPRTAPPEGLYLVKVNY